MKKIAMLIALCAITLASMAQKLQSASPEMVGIDANRLAVADELIQKCADNRDFPGAVFAVVRHGKLAHLKAFNRRQWVPDNLPMLSNTIFDLASVSKSTSTAISVMMLLERGQIRLNDKVKDYLTGFQGWVDAKGDTTDIRIVDLLTHTSGIPPYAPVDSVCKTYGATPEGLLQYIKTCKRDFAPKTDFQYSCLNFVTLQQILQHVTGEQLCDFAQKNIFDVLGMKDTQYMPKGDKKKRCAATERQPDGSVLVGDVHDPLARILNHGNSGNAGVFSTAEDLAILSAALLNGGEYNGHRILGPLTVKTMFTVPQAVKEQGRALGWDSYSPYASNKGDMLSSATVCHSGYTGTSIVIDPENDVAIILLTNAVHPDDSGRSLALRAKVANIVAGAIVK